MGTSFAPGEYPLAKGMTATALIDMAGGFNQAPIERLPTLRRTPSKIKPRR